MAHNGSSKAYRREYRGVAVRFVPLEDLIEALCGMRLM